MIQSISLIEAAAKSSSSSGGFLGPIAKPIASVLAAIYSVIPNYGVAILGLSILWMLIISPLTLKSTRSMLAMQRLQPQLKRLQEQHKNDRQAFAQAQMELFREHNVSPFGSCLPMILPLPVFFALFRVIDGLSTVSHGVPAPKYLSAGTKMYKDIVASHGHLNAFGMDLSKNALSSHASVAAAAPYWLMLVIMGATSYFQSSQMMSRNPAAQQNPQMKMMKYIPLIFVVFCIRFPAGVVLYYAMSNICRIIQQDAMYRFDPKVKALVVREVAEVEERTHEIDESRRNRPGYTPPRSALAGAGGPAVGSGGSRGSSSGPKRFRDLWAAAAEQQKASRGAASPSSGTPGSRGTKGSPVNGSNGSNGWNGSNGSNNGRPSNANGKGAPTGDGTSASAGGAGSGGRPGGGRPPKPTPSARSGPQRNRTNRKRRSR